MFRFQHGSTPLTVQFGLHYDNDNDLSSWVLTIRLGAALPTVRSFAHEHDDAAFRAFHKCIADHQRDGFVFVVDTFPDKPIKPSFVHLTELETTFDNDLDDEEAWHALVDGWERDGDPRGALIRNLKAQNNQHDPVEFLRLRRATDNARLQVIGSLYAELGSDAYRLLTKCPQGLVDAISLENERHAPGISTQELLQAALSHPACRFVRELSASEAPADPVIRALGAIQPPSLRSLRLASIESIDVIRLTSLPRLENLKLTSWENIQWGNINLPKLRSLEVMGRLPAQELQKLLDWCTRQERLTTISIGWGAFEQPTKQRIVEDWRSSAECQPPSLVSFQCDQGWA